jgi:hypothetical protein
VFDLGRKNSFVILQIPAEEKYQTVIPT